MNNTNPKQVRHRRKLINSHELVVYQSNDHYSLRHNIYDEDYYMEQHWHKSIEITYVVKGSKSSTINGKTIPAPEGTLLLVNSGVSHDIQVHAGLEGIVLLLERSYLEYLAPQCANRDFAYESDKLESTNLISWLLEAVACQEEGDRLGTKMAIMEIMKILTTQLLLDGTAPKDKHDDEAYNLVLAIQEHIDYNYASKLSLDQLARLTNYNKTYLATVFKKKVGLTIFEYLKNKRLEQSLYELRATKMTIVEIALKNGFSNIQSFNVQFKAAYAMTPNEYRKKQNISSVK